jgi:hypothetical protein
VSREHVWLCSFLPTQNSISILDLRTHKTSVVIRHSGGLDTFWSLSWSPDAQAPPIARACFSPTGEKIIYTVISRNGAASLWVMNADGSGKHRLIAGDWAAWRLESEQR